MTIIIAGAGRVGFRLARTLSQKHDVIIMDQNEEALARLNESIDALALYANVEDPKSYEPLKGKTYDFFIAVTDSDEINLVCSLIADEKIFVKRKIIRLKNQFFAKSSIASKIGITDAVFPFSMVAESIKSIALNPFANNVKCFKHFSQKLISIRVEQNNSTPSPIATFISDKLHITGIDRNGDFFIPNAQESLQPNDVVFCFGTPEAIQALGEKLQNTLPQKNKCGVIFGANTLGIEIAKALIESGMMVKLIEKDLELCAQASHLLQTNTTVINSKYGDYRLYQEEGLANADILIAATANDNENIVKCIEAKELGIRRVIAVNNDIEHYRLMHSLGIIALRGPKMNAFYAILEIINSNAMVEERHFCGGSALSFVRRFEKVPFSLSKNPHPEALILYMQNNCLSTDLQTLDQESSFVLLVFAKRTHEEGVRTWINIL